MSELYQNLLNRYNNSIKYIDGYGLKGIILFNEPIDKIRTMWVKYKYSKLSLIEEKEEVMKQPNGLNITVNRNVYKINIIEFVEYAISKGYDWRLYGQPQWESIEPKKKTKFMKPKKR